VFFNKYGDPFPTTLTNFFVRLLAVLIVIGAGFVLHELAHKAVSQRYGCWAEFRIWTPGLVIAIATGILSFGTFLFFAPGAVHTLPTRELTEKEKGFISAAGPVANIGLALVFLCLYFLRHTFGLAGDILIHFEVFGVTFNSYPYNVFTSLGRMGFMINMWLAAFNLIPFGPLDGAAVYRWSKPVWIALAVLSWGVILLTMFGVLNI
jgi:Zn-dependent protease